MCTYSSHITPSAEERRTREFSHPGANAISALVTLSRDITLESKDHISGIFDITWWYFGVNFNENQWIRSPEVVCVESLQILKNSHQERKEVIMLYFWTAFWKTRYYEWLLIIDKCYMHSLKLSVIAILMGPHLYVIRKYVIRK